MSATSARGNTAGLLCALIVAAAFLVVLQHPAYAAPGDEKSWQEPDRVATSVEIDDDGIVIRTESKNGGDSETIEIVPEGRDDDVIIIRDRGHNNDWKRQWKKMWKDEFEGGGGTHITWSLSDLGDLDCLDLDDNDGDSIVNFGSDIRIDRDEHIDGDVVAIGGSIYVEGEVDGDVVAIGGSVKLGSRAEVDGDVVALAGDLELRDGSRIDGDAVSVGGGIDDDGARVYGDTVLIEFDLW